MNVSKLEKLKNKMKQGYEVKKLGGLMIISILMIFMVGCLKTAKSCPPQQPADLSGALAYAEDDKLPFQFLLDELGDDVRPFPSNFCTNGCNSSECEYQAAEDYHLSAGTPVLAMADGIVSFSGPMGGYGWLIIIDHPQANITHFKAILVPVGGS